MSRHLTTQRGQAAPTTSTPSLKPALPSHVSPAIKAATQGGGTALDKHTSAEMSARFGHDFSSIRIHTDARAEDAAGAMGAHAFALGSDIVFGAGKYQPGSRDTDRLLAHELTHVVQQAQFGIGDWGRTSAKGDASEREADRLASQVMMGRSVSVSAAPGAAVARDDAGMGIATDENGNASLDLSNGGPFGIPPQVLKAQGVESVPATRAFTSDMGESVSAAPSQASGHVMGGSIGTDNYNPLTDSGLGDTKTQWDAMTAGVDAVEALPILGNGVSAIAALGNLGGAGINALMGDKEAERMGLNQAEDNGLNAIPLFGNLRAAGQAGHDASTLQNDFDPSISPAANQSAENQFNNGGAQTLNKSLGSTWDQLFN